MQNFIIGKTEIKVSPLGLGCWAIGGNFKLNGKPDGYGNANDEESIKAVNKAVDMGVTLFDTSDVYGTGHSERILGKALNGRRKDVVIATKFGFTYDENKKEITGENTSPDYIRKACEASLRRLNTDYIDIYQIHTWSVAKEKIHTVIDTLETLVKEGKIRSYGWSSGDIEGIKNIVDDANLSVIQHPMNLLSYNAKILDLCDKHEMTSIANMPLGMGLLTGKYNINSQLPSGEVRGTDHDWVIYFKNGKPNEVFLKKMDTVRDILTSNGRSLVQGALAWHWGRHGNNIPIPGFKNIKQVEENARAMEFGPLSKKEIEEIDKLLRN